MLQLQELEEFKRDGVRKLDSMERLTSAASKDAQSYEAQLQGLHRQLKEAQAVVRVFEQDSERVCTSAARDRRELCCPWPACHSAVTMARAHLKMSHLRERLRGTLVLV